MPDGYRQRGGKASGLQSRWRAFWSGYRLPVAHAPAPAKTSTNATKTTASIIDRVQLVGIVDNSVTQLE
jgi:hypothetical protein